MSGAVQYLQEISFTPSGAAVAEGAAKPETPVGFTLQTATIQTFANWTKASTQNLQDVLGLDVWLNQRIGYALTLAEENAFVTQLLAVAVALGAAFTPAAGATGLDLIASVISQLQARESVSGNSLKKEIELRCGSAAVRFRTSRPHDGQ
jgi:HK97 family phage major capsid protein